MRKGKRMNNDDAVVIEQSKTGRALNILGYACLIGLAVLILVIDMSDVRFYLMLSFKAVAVLGVVLFGRSLIKQIISAAKAEPLFRVDENGVTDNTSALGFGLIEWKDIKKVQVAEINGIPAVCIALKDPEKYYPRLPKKIQAEARENAAKGPGQVWIAPFRKPNKGGVQHLADTINDYRKNHDL